MNKKNKKEEIIIDSDDSAELIRQELAKPPSYARLHCSSITKNQDDSFSDKKPKVTPSSVASRSLLNSSAKKHRSYSSDEESIQKPRKLNRLHCGVTHNQFYFLFNKTAT